MAQFITHIQPTLVEASHHHVPHPHPHHHKEHHPEKHEKHEKHHKESDIPHNKDIHGWIHLPKIGHPPQHYPVVASTPSQLHPDDDSGQYLDSHGIPHTYQLHFIDSQGIHRDYHGYAEDCEEHVEEKPQEKRDSRTEKEDIVIMRKAVHEDRSPYDKEENRPTPPQFIDLHQGENKSHASEGNTAFLRAARAGQLDKLLEHLKSNTDINTSNANGLNALHLASKDGHVEVVRELLKRGALVDAATKKGNTALHIASLAGQEAVVRLLVQNGASVNVQSQNGFTPLYMAAQENHDNVVRYLLANGANQSLATEDGFTPLAVAMQQGHDKVVTVLLENDTRGKVRLPALHIAAKKDDVKAAKLLLENEHNPDVTSKSGFTPLHIASHYGNQDVANLLIQKKADVNYAAKHNITPLHVAAKWGKTNMVALLLENGATIDAKTRDGLTPLHCAARSGHEQVVDMLLEKGAPISSKTKNGLAPLHMAAQGDHVDAARILLYHRAPVDEVTVDYLTALHVAAHCGHVRVAKLLLDRQADANARALNGFTPLHIACKKNRIKVVELLLKHGASIGATTESGLTPLHVASFMGCMNIVIYLLQHDANPDAATIRGETPLHLAARANQTDIIRILLRNGAQVDARAREQQTPLHIASRLGNVDIVMLLLQHGSKVDNATKDMYTALHIAAKEGQDEVTAVLLDNGASINATTKKGFTPLHLASKYGHLKVAKLLLQREAPVDAQGKNGVTPLHVASHYDHQNVALLLLDKGASPHATAKNGHTPLHIAARKNQMDIANTLLEYGAQPNAESKAGFTPLHLSAQEGHVDMCSLLLEHKANPNQESKNGLTPLHLCAQEDRVPVAEVLVKNGSDVNSATKAGYTPLHIACHYGQTNMVKFLLKNKAQVESSTSLGYTPLHQAAQQGHTNIVNVLLENQADPNAVTTTGQTPLNIAQKLGYITVIETLKLVTTITNITTTTTTTVEEKYRVQAPEAMQETFMSDSEEEGGEDAALGDQTYRYLTADEMKSLGDDSLPIDVTRDERIDSNRIDSMLPTQHIEDSFSPEHISNNYSEYISKYTPDNVDINRHPIHIGKLHWKNFLVSFLVDARGGAMRGCRHSGVRVIVPPRCAPSPTRITCRYVRPQRTPHPPPLMEGEALASRILELGPVGAKFLGPVIIEVPHFAALRGKEREIVILRSDNGESWKEHTVEASEEILNNVLHESFEAEDLNQMEDVASGRITRIVTQDFPQYFAVVSRIRQEVHAIGPEGGMVSSTVVPQVQAIFPEGALTKKIKVGLQAQPIDPELTAKLLGHGVAVSPVVTVEPRRRKFHKAIRLNMPAPTAHSQGMINQYSGSAPTLRLLCSITGGTTRAQWEDVTGSTPLTFVNDVVSFTTTVSARFWLMDCRNISDATKMATELYKEAIHVPFMAKFVVFAKRIDPLEARLRVFCMTDDKEDKTLEHQEHFTEVAKSRDVEVLEGKSQYIEFSGNLVPVTKSGDQLQFAFRAFRENRLPFSVRVKDQHAEAVGRCLFMKEAKLPRGEPAQQPICILNIVLPDDIVTDTISLTDSESGKRHMYLSEFQDYYKPDPRLADMSNLLGEDWVELAHQLGLTSSEINVIKSEYPESVAKQAQSMLRMWLSQSGNKVHTNTLENALKRIGREDIIPQCLNVEQPLARIKSDVVYRLKGKEEEKRKILEQYDKYSAEEKVVVQSESEEEEENAFDRTVTERREQIEKRLSAERAIPASAQRREIVQEISDIKRQSLVEEKVAEVMQKVEPGKTISETVEIKTTPPSSDSKGSEIVVETRETRFVEEVSSRFDGPQINVEQRAEGPKIFSKTPPPSPADFLAQKQATAAPEWDASRKSTEPTRTPTTLDQAAAQQEISCGLTPAEPLPLTTESSPPQPKPRTSKPDIPLDLANTSPKIDKIVSPVRDDLLDDDEDDFATYSDRKKFWENVTKETARKRMSLHEVSSQDSQIVSKKRSSVHEIVPPVPKPRENKPQTEYQASFTPPSERKAKLESTDDSLDSDKAQKGSSQQIEHTGYISDSEDVENVISDSEIEDRVPQIRERQMSVCVATQRKTIYERSASLPTEDLYEVSRNLKQLKEKYEQKIRDDMIEEQFGGNEEECTPETKTLATMQEERIFAAKELVDKSETEGSEKGEEIPEITVTLSGRQRRISEESDKFDNAQSVEEHILWETAIETQPEEKVSEEVHSDSEMEKIILDTFEHMKVDPDEAKKIATQLIQEIENELQNRSEPIDPEMSTYIKKLAESNGLDQREVELVESVLARRQRELARDDTQASSMEITDEDLRYSGGEMTDYSNTLEQQIGQLEAERLQETEFIDSTEKETKLLVEVERTHSEHKNVIFEEDETISEVEEQAKLVTHVEASGSEVALSKSDSEETVQTTTTLITGDSTVKRLIESEQIDSKHSSVSKLTASSSDESQISGQSTSHRHSKEFSEDVLKETHTNVEQKYEEVRKQEEHKSELVEQSKDGYVKATKVIIKDLSSEKMATTTTVQRTSSSDSNSFKSPDRVVTFRNSSGESHYQSFDSGRSRPCSSDVEAVIAASSEYNTAQENTSTDYHTAISSLDSESSGNLASVEGSRSETLVPSSSDLMIRQDSDLVSDLELSEQEELGVTKMKRSAEMTFQPEPKVLTDEGSVLSMSSTSQKTVIEVLEGCDVSTSTLHEDFPIDNVTITTTSVKEDGVHSASTQITSETLEPKRKGHRRTESISLPAKELEEEFAQKTKDVALDLQRKRSTSSTSSEKSSFEEGEAEAAFSMVAHISPAHKVKQIVPIMEDEDAEKLELELKEKQRKELESRRSEVSPGFIPDITVTDTTPEGERSHSSDSFEMIEKPDIIDDFVVIEEVGKEAQEFDTEGKSVNIDTTAKIVKKFDEDMEKYLAHSAPTPLTGRTTSLEELEFEDSPPRPDGSVSTREYGYEYDKELENNKQWIEKQFQGDRAAMIAAGYGYEMEFERGPLEDIKEEDITDFASSYGSQKESVKDSYSSTPEYDVLAGRRYFTRSGDQDDISMSSLQEFEKLEQAMSLEMRRFHQGSDSSSSGSSKTRFNHQKDDISANSLKEFEGLEHACIQAHTIEVKAKEEEAALGQIDEASESESCTTEKKISETDDEDYEKRMFEIDAIIKQAQTNVERFIDLKEMEKTESLGRGDSYEEVSKVPELELDTPAVKSTIKVQWKEGEDVMVTSTDSLELLKEEERRDSADSLDVPVGDVMTASTDSIEFQAQKELKMISSDSLELNQATNIIQTDSMEDFSSSGKEDIREDPSSSATTHATGSNTMVSSTDTMVDVETAVKRVWFNEDYSGQVEDQPYVSEVLEPLDDPEYSHVIHRRTELPPEIRKITFTGPDADKQLKQFMEQFGEGEDVQESEEVDEHGNVHTKRVVQKRFVLQDLAAAESGNVAQPSQPQETSTSKAETEEVQDRSEKKVPDQHQLSDEMRELLKELERDSEQ